MATQDLATWISALKYSDIPASVINAAVRSFQNSLGSIIGGSNHPTTQKAIRAFQAGVNSTCTCLGQSYSWNEQNLTSGSSVPNDEKGFFTDVSHAVLINGIASHVHDYDDTHLHTVIHPAGAVVVSLIAYAEHLKSTTGRAVTGEEFIAALIAGIETSLRLGNSVSPEHYSAGWHITGTVSPLGVAAALSNLVNLSPEVTSHSLGIASTQPVGIRAHFGTDTKPFHVGRAAQNGIAAVQLAEAGFTAASDSLEGRRGWVEVLGHNANSLNEQMEQLLQLSSKAKTSDTIKPSDGSERELWEIEKNTFKPFPCGIVIHPTIDACIQLHNEQDLTTQSALDDIDSIHLKVHHLVLDLTGKKTPRDGLEAKFSVYHGAAVGLVLGSAKPAEYEDHVVTDSNIIRVRDKVKAEVAENIRSDEVVVTLNFKNGKEVEKHVENSVGSLERPMADEELKEKFLTQVVPLIGGETAREVDKLAWTVVDLKDVTIIAQAAR